MGIKRIMATCLVVVTAVLTLYAKEEYSVADVPNPVTHDRSNFVSDPEGLLKPETVAQVNARLRALTDSTTAEMGVVVLPSIGNQDIESFSSELFEKFKIGKRDKDNGVLFVLLTKDGKWRIETGYGVEGVLPDITAGTILREGVLPAMREGNVDGAVNAATAGVCDVLMNPDNREELRSDRRGIASREAEAPVDREKFWTLVKLMIAGCFFLAWFVYFWDRRKKNRSDYERALSIKEHLSLYLILGIFSAGTALPVYFLAKRQVRRLRNKARKCETCGAKMKKLDEEEDNALLNARQDFEEQLNTVDYDVWVCPECGTVERLPFKVEQNKYKACPSCHTIAEHLVADKVVIPATTKREGKGVKIYECRYCGHRREEGYQIPRKESGNIAAAAIIGGSVGSMLGGGRGGGGFGGGSFGGGRSGGGGASGGL